LLPRIIGTNIDPWVVGLTLIMFSLHEFIRVLQKKIRKNTHRLLPHPITRHKIAEPMLFSMVFLIWGIVELLRKLRVQDKVLDKDVWTSKPNLIFSFHPSRGHF